MKVADFDFSLPEELIALRPLAAREQARLLCVDGGAITDRLVADLPGLLGPDDLLVVNNTRVLPAALTGVRPSRDAASSPAPVSVGFNLVRFVSATPDRSVWQAFARPAKRLRVGDIVTFGVVGVGGVDGVGGAELQARIETVGSDGLVTLAFDRSGDALAVCFQRLGKTPLPPYIVKHRAVDDRDAEDYQTVFAKVAGAVAAPTAGLHFTDQLLARIREVADIAEVTLHVGAGTFLPVKADNTEDHVMHTEWGTISPETAAKITAHKQRGGRVVAVGTTSLRMLESAASSPGVVAPFAGETDLFIVPGFRFNIVDALVTNFHLPRSTLFMLVCAFCGLDEMKAAYAHAIAQSYRFYSYGDACFLQR